MISLILIAVVAILLLLNQPAFMRSGYSDGREMDMGAEHYENMDGSEHYENMDGSEHYENMDGSEHYENMDGSEHYEMMDGSEHDEGMMKKEMYGCGCGM